MRTALVLGGILGLLTAARLALAQSAASGPGEETTITVPEVDVSSGPGDKFYPTGKLHVGDRVRVLRKSAKDPTWLEIEPPADAFSWISSRFLKKSEKDPRIGIVAAPEGEAVSVMPGSTVYGKEPNIESVKVERGLMVTILEDAPMHATGSSGPLVRIKPTPQEVRYIPASAVERGAGIQRVSGPGAQMGTVAAAAGMAQPPAQASDTLQQAQRLYQQALADPRLDPQRRQQILALLQQAQALMQAPGAAPAQGVAQVPGHPNNGTATPGYAAGTLVSGQGGQPAAGHTMALYNTNTNTTPPAPPAAAPTGQPQWKWSSWGMLRKASFQKDGQQMYMLLDKDGKPLLYAVPEPGKTLDPYIDKMVALYGAAAYRSDEYIRMEFMTVSYVAPPQGPAR